jgi:hypothetical protein
MPRTPASPCEQPTAVVCSPKPHSSSRLHRNVNKSVRKAPLALKDLRAHQDQRVRKVLWDHKALMGRLDRPDLSGHKGRLESTCHVAP